MLAPRGIIKKTFIFLKWMTLTPMENLQKDFYFL